MLGMSIIGDVAKLLEQIREIVKLKNFWAGLFFYIAAACWFLLFFPQSWQGLVQYIGYDVLVVTETIRSGIWLFTFLFVLSVVLNYADRFRVWGLSKYENKRRQKLLDNLDDDELDFLCQYYIASKQLVATASLEHYFAPILFVKLEAKEIISQQYNENGILTYRIAIWAYDYLSKTETCFPRKKKRGRLIG